MGESSVFVCTCMCEHLIICDAAVCSHVGLLPVCCPLAYDFGDGRIPSVCKLLLYLLSTPHTAL